MPDNSFIRVDLPAPFSPTSAWTSPCRSSNCTSSSAWTPGKLLLAPLTRSSGVPVELALELSIPSLRILGCFAYVAGCYSDHSRGRKSLLRGLKELDKSRSQVSSACY